MSSGPSATGSNFAPESRFLAAAVSRQRLAAESSRSMQSRMSSDAFTYGAWTESTRNHPAAAPFCDGAQSRNTPCIASIAELSRRTTAPSFIM